MSQKSRIYSSSDEETKDEDIEVPPPKKSTTSKPPVKKVTSGSKGKYKRSESKEKIKPVNKNNQNNKSKGRKERSRSPRKNYRSRSPRKNYRSPKKNYKSGNRNDNRSSGRRRDRSYSRSYSRSDSRSDSRSPKYDRNRSRSPRNEKKYNNKNYGKDNKSSGKYRGRSKSPKSNNKSGQRNNKSGQRNNRSKSRKRNYKSNKTGVTLEKITELIDNHKNDDYSGLDVEGSKRLEYSNIIKFKTAVDIAQIPKLKNPEVDMDSYTADYKGLLSFLKSYNFETIKELNTKNPLSYRIEGGSTKEHFKLYDEIIEDPEMIFEIGFNAGLFAIEMLSKHKNSKVVSVDIMLHDYCWYSKMFIDYKYPGRHILLAGDSVHQVKMFSSMTDKKFDVIFIDGDHRYESAYLDIINCKSLAAEKCKVILDDVIPHSGTGLGPYLAMKKSIEEGTINFVKHYELDDYKDAFAVLSYGKIKKPNKIDYAKIERKLPMYYLTQIVQDSIKGTKKVSKEEVQPILEKMKEENYPIDDFLERSINKL